MHPRRAIRNDFKDALIAAVTVAQGRVYPTMTPKINVQSVLVDQGPVILVYVREETIKPEDYSITGANGYVRRTLEIAIEALCIGLDDDLDDLAEEIEAALEDFVPPSRPAAEVHLHHTQLDVTDAFESVLGGVFMTYEVKYYTPFRAGDDALLGITGVSVVDRGEPAESIFTGPGAGPEVNLGPPVTAGA